MFYSKKLTLFLVVIFLAIATLYPISTAAQVTAGKPLLNTPSVFNPSGIGITTYSYSGIKPFGGRIISMQPCATPAGIMLNIGGPMGGQFLLTNSSQMFDYNVFMNGVWTLGTAGISAVTCKGKSGLFSGGFVAKTAISYGVSLAINALFPGAGVLFSIGDKGFRIGNVIGSIAGFASSFGFGKKLDTLGHPYVIKMVGTSLTP
ncbi:MAG: hypothetical protein AAB475_00870 [Patescibacteria group bacterium]